MQQMPYTHEPHCLKVHNVEYNKKKLLKVNYFIHGNSQDLPLPGSQGEPKEIYCNFIQEVEFKVFCWKN